MGATEIVLGLNFADFTTIYPNKVLNLMTILHHGIIHKKKW